MKIHEPQRRKNILFFVLAKFIGVAIVMLGVYGAIWYFGQSAGAAMMRPAAVKIDDTVSAINTSWTLVTAFLVFFMQAGFMFLEAGFARTREVSNIMIECIFDTCLCGLLFWAFGFAFMFGEGNGWIGHNYFFLVNTPATYGTTGVAFLAFFLFQYAFADTCSTVTSGAMVGRTGFVGDILYSIGVSGFIYPILGHWVWGPNGWLETPSTLLGSVGFHDFAGSTVVHSIGGFIALAGAIVLGPRIGRKFKRDGGGMPPGHDMVLAAVGGVILWFGWYGFNPGSTLSALDFVGIGRIAANTTLAAAAGGMTAIFFVYPRSKKWDTGISINGFLAGLVAITCPCYWVTPTGAVCIGAIAGIVCVLGIDFMEWLRIDDPIGAVAVHGFAGVWGTISLGLFASGDFGATGPAGADTSAGALVKGLFYGGGGAQLRAQVLGSVIVSGATFIIAMAMFYAVKATKTLRISAAGELEGIDIHEHGAPAFHPEFAYMGYSPMPDAKTTRAVMDASSATAAVPKPADAE
jgi:Amt family ammonium transporter